MVHATKSHRTRKAERYGRKPKLWRHKSGRYACRREGRVFYFGYDEADAETAFKHWSRAVWKEGADPAAAHNEAMQFIRPEPKFEPDPEGVTVGEVIEEFLESRKRLVERGRLSQLTWNQYCGVARRWSAGLGLDGSNKPLPNNLKKSAEGRRLIECGWNRELESLTSKDWGRLAANLERGRRTPAVEADIRCIRGMCNYAYKNDLIPHPVKFGDEFQIHDDAALREAKHERELVNGARMLKPDELRAIIEAASQPLQTMIWLGLHGLGNHDVASLQIGHLQLDDGLIDFPRPKTAVDRLIALMPEAVELLREWLEMRPEPRHSDDRDIVFLNSRRERWVRLSSGGAWLDGVGQAFGRLLRRPLCPKCGAIQESRGMERCRKCDWTPTDEQTWKMLYWKGLNFYHLRHIYETVASATLDQVTIDLQMGHLDASTAAKYRLSTGFDRDRLHNVVAHVRQWLLENSRGAV